MYLHRLFRNLEFLLNILYVQTNYCKRDMLFYFKMLMYVISLLSYYNQCGAVTSYIKSSNVMHSILLIEYSINLLMFYYLCRLVTQQYMYIYI